MLPLRALAAIVAAHAPLFESTYDAPERTNFPRRSLGFGSGSATRHPFLLKTREQSNRALDHARARRVHKANRRLFLAGMPLLGGAMIGRVVGVAIIAILAGTATSLFITATDEQLVRAATSLLVSTLTVATAVFLGEAAGPMTSSILNRRRAR